MYGKKRMASCYVDLLAEGMSTQYGQIMRLNNGVITHFIMSGIFVRHWPPMITQLTLHGMMTMKIWQHSKGAWSERETTWRKMT